MLPHKTNPADGVLLPPVRPKASGLSDKPPVTCSLLGQLKKVVRRAFSKYSRVKIRLRLERNLVMEEAKAITSMIAEKRVFNPPEELARKAYIKSLDEYKKIYQRSIDDPEGFWGEMAKQLNWFKKWDKVLVEDFK